MRCHRNKWNSRGGQCKRETEPGQKRCEVHRAQDKAWKVLYRMKNLQKLRAQDKRSYRRNHEKRLAKAKVYREENREELNAKSMRYRQFRNADSGAEFWQNLMRGEVVENKLD